MLFLPANETDMNEDEAIADSVTEADTSLHKETIPGNGEYTLYFLLLLCKVSPGSSVQTFVQSNLVISNSLISNYRLSRSETLVPILT